MQTGPGLRTSSTIENLIPQSVSSEIQVLADVSVLARFSPLVDVDHKFRGEILGRGLSEVRSARKDSSCIVQEIYIVGNCGRIVSPPRPYRGIQWP